jgi:hypothetical protein
MRVLKEGFSLFPDQLENAKALVKYRRALFVDSTGSGKCKLPGSRVHFNGGFPKIEDICEAEFGYNLVDGSTYAPNGSSVAVTNIYRQEDVDVNVFTTKSGMHPNGTDAHRLLCATGSGLDMTYLKDVKIGDYIAKPYFPIFSEVDSQVFTQCILYGIVLGDGCMSYGSRPNVLSYMGTESLVKWIRSVEQPNRVGGIRKNTGVWEYRRTRKDSVISWLVRGDLRTSGNKEVSEKVYSLNAACRFAVLYGYLSADGSASDGSASDGCCEFTTKSESLCRGLCDIMDSLNISYRVTNKDIYKRVILYPIGAWTLKQYCIQYDNYLFKGCDRFLRIAVKLQDSKKDRRILRVSTQFLYEFLMGVRDIPDLRLRKKWQNRYSTIRKRKYLSQELLFELVSLFEELGIERLQGYRNLYFDEIVSKSIVRSDVYDFTVPEGNLYLAFDGINHNTPTILYSFAYLYAKRVVDGLVVFTPKNAHDKEVWKPQIQQFTNFKCINFEDVEKQYNLGRQVENILKGYQIVYCKHTNFKGNYALCVEILDYFKRALTVVDEVHYFRNPTSELSVKASMGLTHTYALWGITATDLSRNSMDTYNIINFVRPGKLGTKWDFMNRFCITKEKVIGRLPGGKLKKAKEVVGFRSISEFREYLSDTLVIGTRTVDVHIHEVPYKLNERERNLYSKIAGGFCMDMELDDENWLQSILKRDEIIESSVRSIKDVERHSSRYIYLQSVVDGAMNSDGTFGLNPGSKSEAFLNLVQQIALRGESALVFFDYYVSLDNIEYQLKLSGIKDAKGRPIKLIETSGRKAQKPNFITKSMCDLNSYIVLCSRASSESENFPFINNVILYNIPTTPITYLQFIGRITRRNTLYPGNLHVWMLLSESIDLYKLTVIGHKMHQMQATTYSLEGTFPQKYMQPVDNAKQLENAKKHLLWKGAV